MTLSLEWRALGREAELSAEQIATGVTVLGRANHAQTGLYSQAFFGLSIGLERLGKLIIIADHATQHSGSFQTDDDLKQIGHDLRRLLPGCEAIGRTIKPDRSYASRPTDPIHQAIETTLSQFATKSRYYNLTYIAGSAGEQTDPISTWWENVAKRICDRHYSESQWRKTQLKQGLWGS